MLYLESYLQKLFDLRLSALTLFYVSQYLWYRFILCLFHIFFFDFSKILKFFDTTLPIFFGVVHFQLTHDKILLNLIKICNSSFQVLIVLHNIIK